MASVHGTCPVCGEEIRMLMSYEPADYSIGIFGGWSVEAFFADCPCELTASQHDKLCEEAERIANDDPEFGIPLSLRDEGGF